MEALGNERQVGSLWLRERPEGILGRAVRVLQLPLGVLERLRQLAQEQQEHVRSQGFRRLFAMLTEQLADTYLHTVKQHRGELEFKRGLVESAALAKGLKGRRHVVRTPPRQQRWTKRLGLAAGRRAAGVSLTIPPRDESGFRALAEIRGKGLNLVANAVAQSAEHVRSLFAMLGLELAFYLGCLNLHQQVVRAMLDKQIKVLFVTHMYDLAHSFHAQQLDTALFLRAERQADGRRTFKLVECEPQPTSYGKDCYRRVFGTAATEPAER